MQIGVKKTKSLAKLEAAEDFKESKERKMLSIINYYLHKIFVIGRKLPFSYHLTDKFCTIEGTVHKINLVDKGSANKISKRVDEDYYFIVLCSDDSYFTIRATYFYVFNINFMLSFYLMVITCWFAYLLLQFTDFSGISLTIY